MSKLPRHVLVADPDYAFARKLRQDLEAQGYVVEVVSDGLSAINIAKTRPFIGAIVDTDLTTVDGLRALSLIKEFKRALPVVITGSQDRPAVKRRVREAGGQAYVVKPCPPGQVIEALRESTRGGAGGAPRRRPSVTLARLEPGQALLIECPGGQVKGRLASRLLAKHPASLAVAASRQSEQPVSLPFGAAVTVGFPMPDGWYSFESHVLGTASHGGQPTMLLAQPKLVSHIQRRRYPRARATFSLELETDAGTAAVTSQDVGEGGMRLLSVRALPPGSSVRCKMEVGTGERITVRATVVWAQELRNNARRYQAGVQFLTPPGPERRRLRAWVEALARGTGATPPPAGAAAAARQR